MTIELQRVCPFGVMTRELTVPVAVIVQVEEDALAVTEPPPEADKVDAAATVA